MAEFLIKAQDSPVPDSPGKWYAAQIVVVMDDGHEWGREEGPPTFYVLKVPGVSKAAAEQYISEWRHNPTYSVVNSNLAIDGFRIKLTSPAVNSLGKGAITLAQVEAFFTRWGATVQSHTSNSVTFDIRILDALKSSGFWDSNVSQISFVETEYNQSTGSHLIEVVSPSVTEAQIQEACRRNKCAYVAPRSFIGTRADVRTQLQDDIARQFKRIGIARRRWYISQTGMTALQNAGGIMSITPQQFVANIKDGFAD